VASDGTGVTELLEAIDSYREYLAQGDRARTRRIENWRTRIASMLRDALFQRILSYYLSEGEATRFATEVAEHKRDPYSLVEEIVDELGKPS
jgi:LAO/AO transport system kinase